MIAAVTAIATATATVTDTAAATLRFQPTARLPDCDPAATECEYVIGCVAGSLFKVVLRQAKTER